MKKNKSVKDFAGNRAAKKVKRISGAQRLEWPAIQGMEAFSGLTGAPLPLIKRVKINGSKAFLSSNRIDSLILIQELFAALAKGSELPDGIATPQDWLATEKAKREAIRRQEDEKTVMPCASAVKQAGEACGYMMSELERRDRELPPALAGLSAVEIGKRMSADTESIRKTLKEKFAAITE